MSTRNNHTMNLTTSQGTARPSMATSSGGAVKARQLSQLHAQLAQLSNNLSDTENLLRMTSVQAEAMRGLGSWHAGIIHLFSALLFYAIIYMGLMILHRFMAASKLGEEAVRDQGQGDSK
ncbi:hypothetical protein PgNI_10570 [Pyricularia grisea]|uniref:Uncharacterized protein n=1 Tax=Pyricularia grisea TaxID=148305 RepID=A0A6P8AXB8_PYRGI|nr:hypothetical protein PgNI_10570 [Pyricularia grisea]TLD06977.1 hypothetical protein PgNI_10570 [Pyricularia grisea]